MKDTALIAGTTGLIGTQLLNQLLAGDYYKEIIVLTRRVLNISDDRVTQVMVDNFDKLADYQQELRADHVFCCLGTTMKKAGSKENFYKVDFTYPFDLAKIAKQNDSEKFLLVSSMGADNKSMFYYNRVKGELEEAIQSLNIKTICIFRPSLLLGKRKEKRTGEIMAKIFMQGMSPFMAGPFRKYSPIHAKTVASGMLITAKKNLTGCHIYNSEEIKKL